MVRKSQRHQESAGKKAGLRSDLSSAEFLEQLFSLLVGVAFQLVTDFDPGRSETQVQVVDAFLDNLIVPEARG